MDTSLDTIKALVELAAENQLAELTVEDEEQKISIKTGLSAPVVAAAPTLVAPSAAMATPPAPQAGVPVSGGAAETPSPAADNFYKVTAPMVGTFYRSPSPTSPAFVEVGSTVSKGQTLCIIEAMKLMNELESEVSGTVKKILVENGSPVEFGQVLFEIEVQSQ